MTTLIIDSKQKPSKDMLKRLSELKDEDIVYDDCPEMTPKMQKAFQIAAKQRNCKKAK